MAAEPWVRRIRPKRNRAKSAARFLSVASTYCRPAGGSKAMNRLAASFIASTTILPSPLPTRSTKIETALASCARRSRHTSVDVSEEGWRKCSLCRGGADRRARSNSTTHHARTTLAVTTRAGRACRCPLRRFRENGTRPLSSRGCASRNPLAEPGELLFGIPVAAEASMGALRWAWPRHQQRQLIAGPSRLRTA
jgi:hypothetical protein